MERSERLIGRRVAGILAAVATLGALASPTAYAQIVAASPYRISVFASAPAKTSQPDSIVAWHDSVIVGFENHVAKDGSDGKSSTIIEYSLAGQIKRTFSVPGHNDGLRVVGGNSLWALQNEDANPSLVVIDLESGTQTAYKFANTPHGGGYDDIVVKDGEVYLTASNPNLNALGVNVYPALVKARLWKDMVLLDPVLSGNANAIDISTGTTVSLNLTDPDSMTKDPKGNIVFVSQADSELVFVKHAGANDQTVGRLGLSAPFSGPGGAPITIDDTTFAPNDAAFLLVTDIGSGVIYRIDRTPFGFEPGQAYSASDTLGLVGLLNLDSGYITPIVTGLNSARGLQFIRTAGHRDSE